MVYSGGAVSESGIWRIFTRLPITRATMSAVVEPHTTFSPSHV